ncbi:sigma-B regulation protein RsbU (phosphoserine phosphatase) [Butyrivibrio sp. INlla18]|uniref:PP2C family protein-serine/threonine phosphatase n=1 Tax=Butyrivibrio sp. INlla18 TaxID=1520806 RepID=UPI00088615E1|nr:PP2C family protein-serine/threonine phosphatase [Butyrivibrio sp. INlla18]SDA77804.1 sigma-B regulation protein RsbU (phosphoserine phosphatase) [Butyrivibrio sp. INlla18]
MKNKSSVNEKALLGIVIFTLFFGVLTCVAGSLIFDRVIEKLYNDKGYVVANLILNDIDHDKIAEYTQTWTADDYYTEMESYLHEVEEHSGAAYIYIAVPNLDHTMRYVYDSDTFIGDSDPISASFEEIWKAYTEGERPTSYLVRKSKKYGFLTSSCLPVKDSSGNVVALLFVDTNMNEILSILGKYIFYMVVISLILLVVFCISNWKVMNRNFLKPIMLIKKSLEDFAQNNGQIDDSLSSIKTGDEIEALAGSVHKMEKDIVKYIDNIQAITAEKERISAELSVATQIQADMLPRTFPPFPNRKEFDIYATMTPAKEVGGDFYDFFMIDDDHIALVMADVSGKGVPAALFMVITKTLIKNRTMMDDKLSTSEILRDVNNQLCEGNDAEMFVTVWLCIIQLSTGLCRITNAGHEHPAVKVSGQPYALRTYRHSIAVATMPDIKFEEHEFHLNPGDSLFVYTDGVTEATDSNNVLFGTDRLVDALNKEKDADATTLLRVVKNDIDAFVGDAPQFDDITMLCFRYFGN